MLKLILPTAAVLAASLLTPVAAGGAQALECYEPPEFYEPSAEIAAPISLTVTVHDSEGTLEASWKDQSDNEKCFSLWIEKEDVAVTAIGIDARQTSHTLDINNRFMNDAGPGTYCFQLFAVGEAGRSQPSNTVCVLLPKSANPAWLAPGYSGLTTTVVEGVPLDALPGTGGAPPVEPTSQAGTPGWLLPAFGVSMLTLIAGLALGRQRHR
jgi:hypothetical protein